MYTLYEHYSVTFLLYRGIFSVKIPSAPLFGDLSRS